MRAAVRERYGPPEVLHVADVPPPQVGPEDVLVRVRAAGVDRGAWHLLTGLPYVVRLAGFGMPAPREPVLGIDLAGTVEEVGRDVTGFAPGDEVLGTGRGTFAELAVTTEDRLVRRPARLTVEQAAALPVSGITALQAVRDHGQVTAGRRVLVVGASGGVGHLAVQVAKALGADVTGVCSGAKADLVRSLGVDRVVDYTREDVAEAGLRYDTVIDIGGSRPLRQLRRLLTATGTLVVVGGEGDGRVIGVTGRLARALALSPLVSQRLRVFVAAEGGLPLRDLVALAERGDATPVVERTYPLADAAAALRDLEAGRVRGKVVLTV